MRYASPSSARRRSRRASGSVAWTPSAARSRVVRGGADLADDAEQLVARFASTNAPNCGACAVALHGLHVSTGTQLGFVPPVETYPAGQLQLQPAPETVHVPPLPHGSVL